MTKTSRFSTPEETIEAYVEACRNGDVEKLRNLFSPSTLMTGYFGGEFYIGTPDPFFDEVEKNPSPATTGAEYIGEITSSELIGKIASVTLREKGYLGLNFSNLFQLAYVEGTWLILSKAYIDE